MTEHIPSQPEDFAPPPPPKRHPIRVVLYVVAALVALGVAFSLGSNRGTTELPELAPVTVPTAPTETTAPLPETEVAEPPVESQPPKPEKNERGNTPKTIGEQAGMVSYDDKLLVNFRVTDITLAESSDAEYASAPENGRFLFVSIEGETTADAVGDNEFYGFTSYDFIVLTEDGTRVNNTDSVATYSAVDDAEALPSQIGPSQRFAGKVALDVPIEHGYLILTVSGTGTGWEWEF